MLVRLYDLPPIAPIMDSMAAQGVTIRRALPSEKHIVIGWVEKNFHRGWASEAEVALSHLPVSCFLSVRDNKLLGFGCYDATCKGFCGPFGVLESERGQGLGKALLLASLHGMREFGYGYAAIGWAGPTKFYRDACGATVIEDSSPGIYRGMLH